MSEHQHDPNANELWTYFKNVIDWVKLTFNPQSKTYRKEMKGIDWGGLYDKHKDDMLDSAKLESEIATLMMDEDVTNKKGIYTYILTRNEKHLNIRVFTDSQKRVAFEKQHGICIKCGKQFRFEEMHGDHVIPWSQGGKTNADNCQMLCQECNNRKSNV